MKCPKCGGHMEETDKRCPYCNSYNEKNKTTNKVPHKENPEDVAFFKKLVVAASGVVFAAIVLLIIFTSF